ncbi:MAG: DUF362 domain-containing protein [Proteobacteria bacterium]|nr:DUF362 domain-containing protein [Pseudomonadota bacterium]
MSTYSVSIVKYQTPLESVRKAVELAGGLPKLSPAAKVVIKPNIVMWNRHVPFPTWGVITTTRVIEDMVILLREKGVQDITIIEGVVVADPKDKETPRHAFETLGYGQLNKKYGVKAVNVFDQPFRKVQVDEELSLNFSEVVLDADFLVNIPVLKTHTQTVASMGIKNLKGLIDIPSRKKCHAANLVKNLHYMVSKLADPMPPMFTITDGIFTNERGPGLGGRAHRKDILIASNNVLSADLVGANVLGWSPDDVPHLVHAAKSQGRLTDLSDITVVGEKIEDVACRHEYDFPYLQNEETGAWLPEPMAKFGMSGLSYRKYDLTMCTYCSPTNGIIIGALVSAFKGKPFDDIEILTGKAMTPTKGKKKTILVGKCMVKAHKDNPDINEMIPINGCPAKIENIKEALAKAGIHPDPAVFEKAHLHAGSFMRYYKDKPEFDETFFQATQEI